VIRKAVWSPRRSCQSMWIVPSPGGRSPRWPAGSTVAARPGWARVWHLIDLPKGYHTTARGRARRRPFSVTASMRRRTGRPVPPSGYAISDDRGPSN
jgi:hypothetical protein